MTVIRFVGVHGRFPVGNSSWAGSRAAGASGMFQTDQGLSRDSHGRPGPPPEPIGAKPTDRAVPGLAMLMGNLGVGFVY